MRQLPENVRRCVEECLRCHGICLGTASNHCLEMGGAHVAPPHFRLMLACAEVCRGAAALMLTNVPFQKDACRLCADICVACADSCSKLEDMDECVSECRRCADTCRAMAA
jgi:hypothetical protein